MIKILKQLFSSIKKRIVKEEESVLPDDKAYGNTSELMDSFDAKITRAIAVLLGFNPDELDLETMEDLNYLGRALYWMACGCHATDKDLKRLKVTGHF